MLYTHIKSIVLLMFLERIGSMDLSPSKAPTTSSPQVLVRKLPKTTSINDIDRHKPKLADYVIKTKKHHKEREDSLTRAPMQSQPKIQNSSNNSRKPLRPQRSRSWDKEFDKFNYLLGTSFDEVIPNVETKDDEEDKQVIKGLTKLIKEPRSKKRAKPSRKAKLRQCLWAIVFPSIMIKHTPNRVIKHRHIREYFGLRKIQEVKDTIIEFVKEYCSTPLKEIYYEKKPLEIINEDDEKKISVKESNKRFPLLMVSLVRVIHLNAFRENLPCSWRS